MDFIESTRKVAAAAVMAMVAALGNTALASPVTLNFAGTVTQVSFDPYDPLAGAVAAGSPFYSYLNFDTDAVDAVPSPDLGSYTLSGFPYGFAAIVGSVVFPVMTTVNISIVDGPAGGMDQYSVFASEGTAGGLGDYFSISMLLEDDTGLAFTSDALPPTVPDLNKFFVRKFDLAGQYTDLDGVFFQYEVQGDLQVPEPSTLLLAGLGLFACVATARAGSRRRKPDIGASPGSQPGFLLSRRTR